MGEIQGTRKSPQYLQGQANKILGGAKVDFYLVHFTNNDGRVGGCLVGNIAGKNPGDKPRAVIIEEEKLPNLFDEPKPWFQEAFNRFLAGKSDKVVPSSIPEPELGDFELKEQLDPVQQG